MEQPQQVCPDAGTYYEEHPWRNMTRDCKKCHTTEFSFFGHPGSYQPKASDAHLIKSLPFFKSAP